MFDLLNNGAHIYFCGLKGMMPGEKNGPGAVVVVETPRKTRFLLSRCFFRSQVAFALLFLALLRANRLSKCFRGTQRIERGCKTTRCRRRRPLPAPAGILEMLERVAKSKGINYEEWFEASRRGADWVPDLVSCVQ